MTAVIGPDKCPKRHQTSHPNGCPGSLPRPRVSDMSDTREAEDAIAQHGFGPSDADQLTKAREEIDELRAEIAHISTEHTKHIKAYQEARADLEACRQVIRDLWGRLGLADLAKTLTEADSQIHGREIPF